MLLGAAIAAADATLLGPALRDRLHEQYRAAGAPLLERVSATAAPGTLGVTLSGSGPTVIAWAEPARADALAATLTDALAGVADVRRLEVAGPGAHAD